MASYQYYDLFATKGAEYIVVILFLISVVPFWRYVNGTAKPTRILARERIPGGLLFDKTHTWSYLDSSGTVRVGLDDFLSKLMGPVRVTVAVQPGQTIRRGEPFLQISNGDKQLILPAPLSGLVDRVANKRGRTLVHYEDKPILREWLAQITPSNWEQDQFKLIQGSRLSSWLQQEYGRLRDFLTFTEHKYGYSTAPIVLQDGGIVAPKALLEMSAELWAEFQSEFIDAVFEP